MPWRRARLPDETAPARSLAAMSDALPADQRPLDDTPVHTADLPPTPTRDRNIVATAWAWHLKNPNGYRD